VGVKRFAGKSEVRLTDCLIHGWVRVNQRRYVLWVGLPVDDQLRLANLLSGS
jgi:hypothetical protein